VVKESGGVIDEEMNGEYQQEEVTDARKDRETLYEVVGETPRVDSRDKVKHIENNDQLFATR